MKRPGDQKVFLLGHNPNKQIYFSLCLLRSSPTTPFRQSSQEMSCNATLSMCVLTVLAQFFMPHALVNVLQQGLCEYS